MKRLVLGCVVGMATGPAFAAELHECDGGPISETYIETAVSFGRTFAGGVTVFQVFPDPNLPNGAVLGVLSPMRGDLAGAGLFEGCTLVYSSRDEISYVNWVDLDGVTASYDPAVGLQIDVPVRYYVGNGEMAMGAMQLLIDQSAGALSVEEVLP